MDTNLLPATIHIQHIQIQNNSRLHLVARFLNLWEFFMTGVPRYRLPGSIITDIFFLQ